MQKCVEEIANRARITDSTRIANFSKIRKSNKDFIFYNLLKIW